MTSKNRLQKMASEDSIVGILLTLLTIIFSILHLASLTTAQPMLTVSTDSDFYEPGSELRVTVIGPAHAPVGIEVRGPHGELIALRQLALDAQGVATLILQLDPQSREGTYTVYAATPGAFNVITFTVIARPSPIILLAPPGQVEVGSKIEIPGFVYPGLSLKVKVHVRHMGGEWMNLGEYEANASGWFSIPLQVSKEGIYDLKAEFQGTQEYGSSSSLASFRAVRTTPQWRVEAPIVARLGESYIVNCSGCDTIVARTVAGERSYKCGTRIVLDVPGPWILYPARDGALGVPAITIVKARLDTRVESPVEVALNEPFTLITRLSIPVPALKVILMDQNGTILAEAYTRYNGVAQTRLSFSKAGEYRIEAVPQCVSVFELGERQPAVIRVLGEKVYVRIIVVDAAGRPLQNSIVEVEGTQYEAPKGYTEVVVRAGTYRVKVLRQGHTVFNGQLRLEGGNVTLKAELYDLKVTVLDLLGRPTNGALVELFNGTQRIAIGVTDDRGRLTIIRVSPGTYTLRVGNVSTEVCIPEQTEAGLRLPPPLWSSLLTTLVALLAATAWAARRYVKISVKKGENK